MTPQQFARIEALFHELSALPPERRAAHLAAQCSDDPLVLRKVEGMLERDRNAPAQLESKALGADFHVVNLDEDERRLRAEFAEAGRYEILSVLGEGGFGSVYRAEQRLPVQRQVALKVIKRGMDTRRVLARFDAERQTLAMLNHHGIAKLFDAGMTRSGRPYFVMDLIEGAPITRYCDERGLPTRARLELFVQVCAAIGHAHQKGVLHRDIKPSNVLVTEHERVASPVIIDFGIARALNDDEGQLTFSGDHGQLLGTPEYMSPEQASGQRDVDTRADIYALGVLLYELLTGTTPLERIPRSLAGLAELQRMIRDQNPPKPSSRLAEGTRRTRPASAGSPGSKGGRRSAIETGSGGRAPRASGASSPRTADLRGDLDWIVMKAIEKDRARRYETVEAFASDVERFLSNQPILARPPSAAYRFRKFGRRNRGPLAAASVISILLIGGVIGTSVGMVRAQREARIARDKTAVAQAVSDFLNNDLLASVGPEELGNDVSMRRVVEVAAQHVEGRFKGQPLAEAAVHFILGRTFARLSDHPAAQRHLQRSHDLRLAALGANALETLETEHELGQLCIYEDRNEEAERLFRRAFEGRRQALGPAHADTLSSHYQLGVSLAEQGRMKEAEPLLTEALELCRKHLGESNELTLVVMRGMGIFYFSMGQSERAGPYFEQAYQLAREGLGPQHPTTLLTISNLVSYYTESGRFQEAEPLALEAIEVSQRRRGATHPATLTLQQNLALVWFGMKREREAEELLVQTLEAVERTLPRGNSTTVAIRSSLAMVYEQQGQFARSEPLRIANFEGVLETLGPDHPLTQQALAALVHHFEANGDSDAAQKWTERREQARNQAATKSQ